MKGLFALSLLSVAVPLGAQKVAPVNTGRADRVFVGGRVWTGEPGKPLVEALAVRGSTMLKIGSSSEIRALAGKGTDVVDLRGRFVAPGLHRRAPAPRRRRLVARGAAARRRLRLRQVAARIGAWAKAHPDARWVTGEGWSYAAFPGGLPTRVQLDALVPDRPAYLSSYDGHTGWANSAALRLAEVTRSTQDPAGGEPSSRTRRASRPAS